MNIHDAGPMWDAFLADVVAHPEDDAPRLILADWLSEQSSPLLQARGELIRLMYDGGRKSMARARKLLGRHFPEWWLPNWPFRQVRRDSSRKQDYTVEPPGEATLVVMTTLVMKHGVRGLTATWRRGFVEHVLLRPATLEEYMGRLFACCPITGAALYDHFPANLHSMGWCWHNEAPATGGDQGGWPDEEEASALSSDLFHRLPPPEGHPYDEWARHGGGVVAHSYADEAEARAALSTAIVLRGRDSLAARR